MGLINNAVLWGMAFLFGLLISWMMLFYVSLFISLWRGTPYTGISKKYLRQIFKLAGLSTQDVLYDLGCGDGRVLIAAYYYAKPKVLIGFEIAPSAYLTAKIFLFAFGLSKKINITFRSLFKQNISDATFVYLYLYKDFINHHVAPKLSRELRAGTRIISVSSTIDTNQWPMFALLKKAKIGTLTVHLYQKI